MATTEASGSDAAMTEPVHDMLTARGLAPAEHAADSGYASGDLLVAARNRGIILLAPLVAATSPQARTGGYTAEMFTIDWDNQQATCPQGATSYKWAPVTQPGNRPAFTVAFPPATCRACPVRAQCTTARGGRQLTLRPREIHQAVAAARAAKTASTGKTATRSAPGSRAPSPRPPTSPASAPPATSACPRPGWNTTSPPPPST